MLYGMKTIDGKWAAVETKNIVAIKPQEGGYAIILKTSEDHQLERLGFKLDDATIEELLNAARVNK